MANIGGTVASFQGAAPGFYPLQRENEQDGEVQTVATYVAAAATGSHGFTSGVADQNNALLYMSFVQSQVGGGGQNTTTITGVITYTAAVANEGSAFTINLANPYYAGLGFIVPVGAWSGNANGMGNVSYIAYGCAASGATITIALDTNATANITTNTYCRVSFNLTYGA